jgi:hypothetical protein
MTQCGKRATLWNGYWIGTRSSREIVRCVCSNAGTLRRGIGFTHRTQITRRLLYVGGTYALIQFYWENSSCPFSCGTFRWLFSSGRGMSLYHPARKEVWRRTTMPSQHLKRRNCRPSEISQVEGSGGAGVVQTRPPWMAPPRCLSVSGGAHDRSSESSETL